MSEILKKGIDVSKYQGAIDWPRVKASGVDFAFIRSTFGWDNDAQLDPCCNANMWGCEAAGIPYGLYHYSYIFGLRTFFLIFAQQDANMGWKLRIGEGDFHPLHPI